MYNSNTDSLGLILGVEVFFSLGHCSGALCILIISIYVSTEKQPRIVVTRKICAGPVPPAELPPRRRGRASNLRLGWRGVVLVRAGGRAEAAGDGDTDGPGQARAAGGGGDIMSTSFVIFSSTPPPLLLHPDTADTNKIIIPTTCPQLRCLPLGGRPKCYCIVNIVSRS